LLFKTVKAIEEVQDKEEQTKPEEKDQTIMMVGAVAALVLAVFMYLQMTKKEFKEQLTVQEE
jgi:hypothetical protein